MGPQPQIIALSSGLLALALVALARSKTRRRLLRKMLGGDEECAEADEMQEMKTALFQAEARVQALKDRLLCTSPARTPARVEVRIWMDGAFDMMHYGHANAFRQGRALGTHLVVGINDDESITNCKGPPLLNNEERITMVQSCKWVDEVVPRVPYIMSAEYVQWVIQTFNIDYVVHGDDPCIVDGKDVYESAKALGKYRSIPRTEGVSTTEIVGRMLLLSKDHHSTTSRSNSLGTGEEESHAVTGIAKAGTFIRESKFMTTSNVLGQFAGCCSPPPPGARVVYVDGGWDMFHAGHVDFLRAAAQLGDYLLVGVHNDTVVNQHRGSNFPIMNTNERVLSVLGCKFVGDVVIDPPWHMTREMIAALRIAIVAHGTAHDDNDDLDSDPYEVPKAMGIFQRLPSQRELTVDVVFSRVQDNHERLAKKVDRKMSIEKNYYSTRYGFDSTDTPPASSPK